MKTPQCPLLTFISFDDTIKHMIKKYLLSAVDLFYPNYCLLDGEKIQKQTPWPICENCLKDIKFISAPICSKCGKSIFENYENQNINVSNYICPKCSQGNNWFRVMRSACFYEGVIKKSIHFFKYRKKIVLRKFFAKILLDAFKLHFTENYDFLTYVPMHPLKKFFREFNHSELLAHDLSANCGIKYAKNAVKRRKFTRSQIHLNSSQRAINIKNSFAVSKSRAVKGKKILLIDDVATTLNTVNELSKTLLLNGAEFVDVLTAARG